MIIRDNGIGKLYETIRIQTIGDIRFYKTFIRRFRTFVFPYFRAQSAIRVEYRNFLRRRALRRDRRHRRRKLLRQLFRRFKGIVPHNRGFFRFGKYAVYVVDLLFQLRFRRLVRQCVVLLYQPAYVPRRGVRYRRHHYIHRVADHVLRASVRVFPPLYIQIEISVRGKFERYELPLSLFRLMIFADLPFPCCRRSRRGIHRASSCLRICFEVEEYFDRRARFVLDLRHHPQRGIRRPVLAHFNVQRRFAEMSLAFAKGYRPADFFPRRCKHYFAYALIIRDNGIGKLHETIRIQTIGDIRFYKTFVRRLYFRVRLQILRQRTICTNNVYFFFVVGILSYRVDFREEICLDDRTVSVFIERVVRGFYLRIVLKRFFQTSVIGNHRLQIFSCRGVACCGNKRFERSKRRFLYISFAE